LNDRRFALNDPVESLNIPVEVRPPAARSRCGFVAARPPAR
jgi:hypothetical protein